MLNSTIVTATDDFGPEQGPIPNGGTTDDTTPTFQISISSDVQAGDTVTLDAIENLRGNFLYSQVVTADDVARGYVLLTPSLQDAQYIFKTFVNDPAGNQGPDSPNYSFSIKPDGQTLQSSGSSDLVGGGGDDTLIGGTGPDTMTGNAGADHFVWQSLPWQGGEITDFKPGTDKLDLSALLSASHYTGSDPIGDGYVKLISDGQGDTWLYYDTDGKGTADQFGTFVAKLDGVQPNWVTDSDLIFGGSASPPPTSPPPVSPPPTSPPPVSPPPSSGQTLQSSGSSNLVGGSGDDTLIGSTGPDTMTGGGGADHFVWNSLPWQGGEVTDFTHGVDKIDLSALLAASNYSGSDPIGDGYVKLIDDGQGDTWLYYDTDGKGTADQWGTFVAKLDHVAPSQVTDSDLIFGGAASPPPTSPPPVSPPPVSPPPSGQPTATIVTAIDDFGPKQGTIPNGGQTDDTTPTFHISLSASVQAGEVVTVDAVENNRGNFIYNQTVTSDDVARGYMLFTLPAQQDGHYDFSAFVHDPSGTPGPISPDYSFDIQPDGQTLQSSGSSNLVGGSGNDTLIGSTGPDTMTGNAGDDHFVWNSLPWQGGEITDFTHGQDVIDVSHLLAGVGYAGIDPIGDGYVKLIDDGAGDTWLYFDTDGHGTADQWGTFVAKIDHVGASTFTSSDFIFH